MVNSLMNLLIFRSERNPQVFGFTEDERGANFPSEYAPWTPFGNAIRFSEPIDCELAAPVAVAVARDGYFVAERDDLRQCS